MTRICIKRKQNTLKFTVHITFLYQNSTTPNLQRGHYVMGDLVQTHATSGSQPEKKSLLSPLLVVIKMTINNSLSKAHHSCTADSY